LAVLIGQPPGALLDELGQTKPIPPAPPSVPVGLPSDLLLRRPDVRRTERQLASATAQIGVATAELFPKFSLTGAVGLESLHAANFFSPASEFWNAGPTITWRLLEYPRLRATIRAQSAQQEEVLAQYYQTVLMSLEDVENALIAFGKEQERRRDLEESVQNNRRSLELANQLYTKGLGEFLNVLDSQRSLYIVEDQLAQSEQSVSINAVALYKALGGGWESEEPKP
jgi:NodT family efflux transporter outer membrane factor (OMF) lipoprotein